MTINKTPPKTLLGPVMLDVAGLTLTDEEREVLRHPLVGGVILFSRNFSSPEQLQALTQEIHSLRDTPLVITVDHEGGRVQRFRTGFTRLPPMRVFADIFKRDPDAALESAHVTGFVLAAELRAYGVDLSFAPVLDLDYGTSEVIGNRAFNRDPMVVAQLAEALVEGLSEGGMASVGKHFPGHGFVAADSHTEIPVDHREFDEIWDQDIAPYRERVGRLLAGIMPAHVIYDKVDASPAGFSQLWLHDILRDRVGFNGVIFSDDLSMQGATVAGDIVARANAAMKAGCHMVLVCNAPNDARELLSRWDYQVNYANAKHLSRLVPPAAPCMAEVEATPRYQTARAQVMLLTQMAQMKD